MEKAKAAYRSRDGVVPNPNLKLLDQVREVIRIQHYSIRTDDAYVQQEVRVRLVNTKNLFSGNMEHFRNSKHHADAVEKIEPEK